MTQENLLLELDFIQQSPDNETYFVNRNYTDLFFKAFSRRQFSPKTLKIRQAENDLIGYAAEIAVIDFETKRLTDISLDPKEIDHISQNNVLAGYDIQSFENYFDHNLNRIPRFIEVKAVSSKEFKFYWSRNEIEISKVFGERYHLYLLPVGQNNNFDFDNLMIVKNPFMNIYSRPQEWKKEEESISFTKNIQ